MARTGLVLVNHFPLSEVTGVTVMLTEIVRLWPTTAPTIDLHCLSFTDLPSRGAMEARFAGANNHIAVGVNLHIEVNWDLSEQLFALCKQRGIPAYNFAHDYWPHHRQNVETLTRRYEVRFLASTPFIRDSLGRDGFVAKVLQVGVPLPDQGYPTTTQILATGNAVVGSAGRLSPRKRFSDVVLGFCAARQNSERLHLRLLSSLVFHSEADFEQLRLIESEIQRCNCKNFIDIDRAAIRGHEYFRFSSYVCASSYEGFSMAPIEASYYGCPPIMSAIPPHIRIAQTLLGRQADSFLFPVGDTDALARILRDELTTHRRAHLLSDRRDEIQSTIRTNWSLHSTVRKLASLVNTNTAESS